MRYNIKIYQNDEESEKIAMASVKDLVKKAEELMKQDAILVTAAEYDKSSVLERIQVYFWDERDAAMDVIDKDDLVQGFPEAGAWALTGNGLKKIVMFEGAEDMFFRIDGTREEADALGDLPTVRFMETVEAICALQDKTKL